MEEPSTAVSCSCVKHPMTMGEHICGGCGHQFCTECVVYPFGSSRPPLCIACALERGGVRRQATGPPKLSRRSIKERLALQRRQSAEVDHAELVEAQAAAASPTAPDEDDFLSGQVDPIGAPGAWHKEY